MKRKYSSKQIIALIVCIVLGAFSLVTSIKSRVDFSSMTLEEKIVYAMNDMDFSSEPVADNVLLLEKIEDGYLCALSERGSNDLYIGFVDDGDFAVLSSTVQSKKRFVGEEYDSPDGSYTSLEQYSSVNFKGGYYYYGFRLHADDGKKAVSDGKEIEVYTFGFDYEGKAYTLDLWFAYGDKSPVVSFK